LQTIGRYQVVEKLGHGGMGTVYKAFDPLLARVVAVKVISTHLDGEEHHRDRFFREARAAAHLSHRNIITIHDLGEDDAGVPFLAMEFLEGRDLERRMKSPEGMSLVRKLEIALETCDGLAHAHSCNIIHRDIKPANIFITDSGEVKLLDFGLARLVTSELTRSNVMVGTINYMAPEQVRAEKVDHRADIFSLGVVFYELFGGRKPFDGDSFASTMYKILSEVPEPLDAIDPNLPPQLAGVIDRAMAKAREDRYQHVVDLRHDLEAVWASVKGSGSRATLRGTPPPEDDAMLVEDAYEAVTIVSPPPRLSGSTSPTPPSTRRTRPPSSGARPPSAGTDQAAGTAPEPPSSAVSAVWWRAPVLSAGVVIVVLGVVAAYWMTRTPRSEPQQPAVQQAPSVPKPAPAPVAPAQAPAPPTPAPAQPDRQTPASSPEADAARDARNAARIARTNKEARAAFDARRYDESLRLIAEALALDPKNRDALALRTQLREQARKDAAAALAAMETSKRSAVAANARELSPVAFGAADDRERAARQLYDRQEFRTATAQLYEAGSLYGKAESAARAEAEVRGAQARAAEAARRTVPPPAAKPEPAPTPPPPKQEPAPPPVQTAPAPEEAIRAVVQRYVAALEARDMGGLRAIWPGMSGAERSAIQQNFEDARSIAVRLDNPRVEVSGGTARVTGLRHYTLQTRSGQRLESEAVTTLTLRRAGSAWIIESIRYQAAR
jgi:serine/threonine-protein kinase